MAVSAIFYTIEFNNYLNGNKYDAVIIRGDRYEMLGLAMISLYRGLPIVHIEGGDVSGVVDGKVRHAITHLSDYHFCTNEESHKRLIGMGMALDRIWNFGSLDVEFANKVEPKKLKDKPYLFVTYHPILDEDERELDEALKTFTEYDIIRVGSNKDYGREYGSEQYSPEDYINLMRFADVCIGNSSSLIKESSTLGVPVVLVGDRQKNRLLPKNVFSIPCERENIIRAVSCQRQLPRYKPDPIYSKSNTSINICQTLKEIL